MKSNSKSRIYKNTDNMNFIGIKNTRKYSNLNRAKKVQKKLYEYKKGETKLSSIIFQSQFRNEEGWLS